MQRHNLIRSDRYKSRLDARKHNRGHAGASRIRYWNGREYRDQEHLPPRRALADEEPGPAPNDEKAEDDAAAQLRHGLQERPPVLPVMPAPSLLPKATAPGWERPGHPADIRALVRQRAV